MAKYRVLVVDDSAFIRQFLSDLLNGSGELEVTATAVDPIKAIALLERQEFDVVTLDVEMPRMDGLTFLRYLMKFKPLPVVMISSWTQQNSALAIKALSLGAVDIVAKPTAGLKEGMTRLSEEIITKVKAAARARISTASLIGVPAIFNTITKPDPMERTDRLIVIGASTGGTIALNRIFRELDPDLPGIIVVQHMPALFTQAFAASLDQSGLVRVREASDGDQLMRGMALVAPGGRSLAIRRHGHGYRVKVGPPLKDSFYCPSIDYTMESIALAAQKRAMGVILTGMGHDGAAGLAAMNRQGAYTIVQDQATSVIFGMPAKALEQDGACKVVPLERIAPEIIRWSQKLTATGHLSQNPPELG